MSGSLTMESKQIMSAQPYAYVWQHQFVLHGGPHKP